MSELPVSFSIISEDDTFHKLVYRDFLLSDEIWTISSSSVKSSLTEDMNIIRFRVYRKALIKRLNTLRFTDNQKSKIKQAAIWTLVSHKSDSLLEKEAWETLALYALEESYLHVVLALFLADWKSKQPLNKALIEELAEFFLIDSFSLELYENL